MLRGRCSPLESPWKRARPRPPAPGTCRWCRRARRGGGRTSAGCDLRVVGCDNEEVLRRHGVLPALLVPVSLREQAFVHLSDRLGFLPRALAVAVVLEGKEDDSRRAQGRMGAFAEEQGLRLVGGLGAEAVVVDRLGDEAADIGVHAERGREEDAARGRDGGEAVEEVVERRVPERPGWTPGIGGRAASDRRADDVPRGPCILS